MVDTNGEDLYARVAEAVALHRGGRLEEAERIYREVLQADPRNADALHFLGLLHFHRGDNERAIALMRDALSSAPEYVAAYVNLGGVLKMCGEAEAAEACLRRALELDPRQPDALNNLGIILKARGDLAGAEMVYRRAVEADPDRASLHQNLGNVLRRLGRLDEAAAEFRRAIALDPQFSQAREMLGLVLHAAGDVESARKVYREWLALDPDNPAARHMRAAVFGEDVPTRASDDYVRELFDDFASGFDERLAELEYRAPQLVEAALAREMPQPDRSLRVLDAGCGTGLCASFLRPYASELVGVDLSRAMLQRAARIGIYDGLAAGELTAFLCGAPGSYGLIVAADTLCYFGALDEVLQAMHARLDPGGVLVFTVEHWLDEAESGYVLNPQGRYAHGERYVSGEACRAGFGEIRIDHAVLRTEFGNPVAGLVVSACRGN